MKVLSNVLVRKNSANWKSIQRDPDNSGSVGVASAFDMWVIESLRRIEFNLSKPMFCNKVSENVGKLTFLNFKNYSIK